MNKLLELVEAQKLFNIPKKKIDILIHPNSLVHAIIELNNGLTEIIYHETTMMIPIANAIFDSDLMIDDFYKKKQKLDQNTLYFEKVNARQFPLIKLKYLINLYPSSAIIINACNEVAVNQFLQKRIPF